MGEQQNLPWDRGRPSYLVGVCGSLDLDDAEQTFAKEQLRLLFRFLRHGGQGALPHSSTTYADHLAQLIGRKDQDRVRVLKQGLTLCPSLEEVPIVVMSNLARGVDTLAVEVANEPEFRNQHFYTWGVLPYPPEVYERASTFLHEEALQEDFRIALASCDKWHHAKLQSDRAVTAPGLRSRLEDEVSTPDSDASNQRYLAAGEYLATFAHLLISISNGAPAAEGSNINASIERARLFGPSADLLPTSRANQMPNGGPLVRLYPDGSPLNLHFPATVREEDGIAQFGRASYNLRGFESKLPDTSQSSPELLSELLTDKDGIDRYQALSEEAKTFCDWLKPSAWLKKEANDLNEEFKRSAERTVRWLFWLTAFSAVAYHFYAHWYPQEATSPQITGVFGLASLAIAILALVYYGHRNARRIAERGHDSRALAEGLRVQIFWNICGLGESVSANYLLRQRSELDWIRASIRSVCMPYEAWRDRFNALAPGVRVELLTLAHKCWVEDQERYYRESSQRYRRLLEAMQAYGGALSLAGVLTAAASVFAKYNLSELASVLPLAIVPMLLLWAVLFFLRSRRHSAHDHVTVPLWTRAGEFLVPLPHDEVTLYVRQYRRWIRMLHGFSAYLPLAGILAVLFVGGCVLLARYEWAPESGHLLIIATGSLLIVGGVCVALPEKQLRSEESYKYSAIHSYFAFASNRLRVRLGQGERPGQSREAFIIELQSYFRELGKEALDENAEWLLLHRSRPLEPATSG